MRQSFGPKATATAKRHLAFGSRSPQRQRERKACFGKQAHHLAAGLEALGFLALCAGVICGLPLRAPRVQLCKVDRCRDVRQLALAPLDVGGARACRSVPLANPVCQFSTRLVKLQRVQALARRVVANVLGLAVELGSWTSPSTSNWGR